MAKRINSLFDMTMTGKTIQMDAPLRQAVKMMEETGTRSLLVKDGQGNGVGILSEHDIVKAFATYSDSVKDDAVANFMTLDLVVAEESADIDYVIKLMAEHNVRHMPVISDTGRVISFLTVLQILMAKITTP
jgi:CBS domain-containing protein